jgi:site-specific recombinase XerC
MLFDWLVVGQVVPVNPASSVRGPKHVVKKRKTPVLSAEEARVLIDSIDTDSQVSLRDRALIGIMVYTFARIGAVIKMRVEDVYVQGRRTWARLHEKGGKRHEMPCHHNLDEYLQAYIEGAGIAADDKGYLFRTSRGRTTQLSDKPMAQEDVYRLRLTEEFHNRLFRTSLRDGLLQRIPYCRGGPARSPLQVFQTLRTMLMIKYC